MEEVRVDIKSLTEDKPKQPSARTENMTEVELQKFRTQQEEQYFPIITKYCSQMKSEESTTQMLLAALHKFLQSCVRPTIIGFVCASVRTFVQSANLEDTHLDAILVISSLAKNIAYLLTAGGSCFLANTTNLKFKEICLFWILMRDSFVNTYETGVDYLQIYDETVLGQDLVLPKHVDLINAARVRLSEPARHAFPIKWTITVGDWRKILYMHGPEDWVTIGNNPLPVNVEICPVTMKFESADPNIKLNKFSLQIRCTSLDNKLRLSLFDKISESNAGIGYAKFGFQQTLI